MTTIGLRPAEVDSRLVLGRSEVDLIKGARNGSGMGPLIERTSRDIMLTKLDGRGARRCAPPEAVSGGSGEPEDGEGLESGAAARRERLCGGRRNARQHEGLGRCWLFGLRHWLKHVNAK